MLEMDLNKQQALGANPKATQEINFRGNLGQPENITMFSIIEEAKETILEFPQGAARAL